MLAADAEHGTTYIRHIIYINDENRATITAYCDEVLGFVYESMKIQRDLLLLPNLEERA